MVRLRTNLNDELASFSALTFPVGLVNGHLARKNCPRNELYSVEWDVKLRLTQSLPPPMRYSDEYCLRGLVTDFQQYLDNIFEPLFRATLHPDSNAQLDAFLQSVGRHQRLITSELFNYYCINCCNKLPKCSCCILQCFVTRWFSG